MRCVGAIILLTALWSKGSFAQYMEISGGVKTSDGRPVPGTIVKLINPDNKEAYTSSTGAEGEFYFTNVPKKVKSLYVIQVLWKGAVTATAIVHQPGPQDPIVIQGTATYRMQAGIKFECGKCQNFPVAEKLIIQKLNEDVNNVGISVSAIGEMPSERPSIYKVLDPPSPQGIRWFMIDLPTKSATVMVTIPDADRDDYPNSGIGSNGRWEQVSFVANAGDSVEIIANVRPEIYYLLQTGSRGYGRVLVETMTPQHVQ